MGFWDSKNYYPPDALHTVTLKATAGQRAAWNAAAKKYGKGTRGAFLAWAGDMAITLLASWESANRHHEEELNPRSYGAGE